MNKKVRMIVAVFLSLVMFMQNTCLNAYAAEIIPTGSGTLTASEPDMSLNAEISYGEAVIESFAYETSADVTILDHTRADVCNYIPEGAHCTHLSVISGHVYLTYVLDGVLYWIVY